MDGYTFRVLIAGWLITGCVSAAHAIMSKRDPKSAGIWVLFSFGLPLLGPWLYVVIEINRLQRRAQRRRARRGPHGELPEHAPQLSSDDQAVIGHLQSLRTMADRVTRMPLLPGNLIEPLHNGEEAYPAMLGAIEEARETITLESYIFDCDDVGWRFIDAVRAAAARGVRVHVLVDGIGAVGALSRMGRRLLKSGAQVAAFLPVRLPLGRMRINLRNHRKILVVDGKTGFTGGMNISRRHLVEAGGPGVCEDLHFRVTGPVVAEMQQAFVEDWLLATGEQLAGPAYFPAPNMTGCALARGIISGPDEDFEKIHWMLLAAFAAAQRTVRIATPYFVPTPALIAGMTMAALRGVQITLILPSVSDVFFMPWVATAYLEQFLEHGVRVYRRRRPFVHTKLTIVDERWLWVGSANYDPRSFRLNFEFNLEAYHPDLAAKLATWLDGIIPHSIEVTLDAVRSRSGVHRFRDGLAKLFSPYL
jgi:cardiolipin synthase